eukprot:Skav207720  [mRNA]  locus=scaffold1347:154768:159378:- [translate_table: standard]
MGLRVDLEVMSFTDGGIMARPCNPAISTKVKECVVPAWCLQYMDVGMTFTILDFQVDSHTGVFTGKNGKLFPILHPVSSATRVAEAFGGLGGWTLGAKLTGAHVSLIIEADSHVAQAASRSLGIPCFSIETMMEMARDMNLPDVAIVTCDVLDSRIWAIAGFMGIACWLASPPCPPWSGASRVRGLFAEAGQTLVRFIYYLGISKCRCVSFENVPGIAKHLHFVLVKTAIQEAGLELVVASVDRLTPLLPATRPRWLATCVRKGYDVPPNMLARVKCLGIPTRLRDTRGACIQDSDVVQWCLHDWELCQCIPSPDAIATMKRHDLLPLNMRTDHTPRMTPEQILQLRIKSPKQILPNVMALQGSQHELPEDLLQERGLHSFLVRVGEFERFSTPFEILGALGFPPHMTLPDDFKSAWHMVGNTLSVAHAALQCLRARWLLGDASGMGTKLNGAFDICEAVADQMIRFSDLQTTHEDGWMQLVPLQAAGQGNVDPLSDAESHVSVATTIHDALAPVSSTIPFSVHEPLGLKRKAMNEQHDHAVKKCCFPEAVIQNPNDPVLIPQLLKDEFPNLQGMRVSTMQPLQGECCFVAFPDVTGYELVVKLVHSQGIWSTMVVKQSRATVRNILQTVLPHAVDQHFHEVRVNGVTVDLDDLPASPSPWEMCFRPYSYGRVVFAPFLTQELVVEVDVTWTIADLRAYVAVEAAILPTQLLILQEGSNCPEGRFVLTFPAVVFHAQIQRSLRSQVECDTAPAEPHQHLEEEAPKDDVDVDDVRITFFDAKWKVVRSVLKPTSLTAATLLATIFPGRQNLPMLVLEDIVIDHDTQVKEFPFDCYHVKFDDDPCSNTFLVVSSVGSAKGGETGQGDTNLWIRGPFTSKAMCHTVKSKTILVDLVAKMLAPSRGEHTIQILQNGKLMVALDRVRDIDHLKPMEFRLCQLKGGAKGTSAQIKKLRELLLTKGVSSDAVAERVATIQSKIAGTELNKIMNMGEHEIWGALKAKANQSQVRLVTSNELKEHQKSLRLTKPVPDNPPKGSGQAAKKRTNVGATPKVVSINPMHFETASGDRVPLISSNQWGPDTKGITVVSKSEAEKHMPPKRLSADPLALVVLTDSVFHGLTPTTVPATDHENQPILASAVVVNFGDQAVHCRPSLPKVELEAVPTVIVEVTIQKAQALDWDKVRNPLDYLGQQIPEIRKNQVVSSWSWKTFDANRGPCSHDKGKYAHGYMRITEAALIPTLSRSGQAGVYLQPKTSDRKPDQRFGIITMHGLSLEEVSKHAQSCKEALGIVQVGREGAYAVRARREHITAIRQQITPNSICVQQGAVPSGATWWMLRNLHVSTTCQELSAALVKLGWQASAIKPSGKSAWVVCSVDDPPATHLCIGQDYVAVTPLLKTRTKASGSSDFIIPAQVSYDASMCPEDDEASTTTASRLSDMKNELEDRLIGLINEKVKGCDEKIAEVAHSVAEVRANVSSVAEQAQKGFCEVKEQHNNIQMQIQQNNAGMLKQMKTLFEQMQQDFRSTFAEGERKCQKIDKDL